jgi:outer membrane protein assembly factor BamB
VRTLGEGPYALGGGGIYRVSDRAEVVRETAAGRMSWSRRLEHSEVRILAASQRHVFAADLHEETTLHTLDAKTGRAIWMRPFRGQVSGVHPSGPQVLLRLERKLLGLDAATGEVVFRGNAPKDGALEVHAIDGGWVLAAPKKLIVLSNDPGDRGKLLAKIDLPDNVEHIAVVPGAEKAFIALADGTVAAADLRTGAWKGRVVLGRFAAFTAGPRVVAAIEDSGRALWVFDGERALTTAVPD